MHLININGGYPSGASQGRAKERVAPRPPLALIKACCLIGCRLERPQAPAWAVSPQVPQAACDFDVAYSLDQVEINKHRWSQDSGTHFPIPIKGAFNTVFPGNHLAIDDHSEGRGLPKGSCASAIDERAEAVLGLAERLGSTGVCWLDKALGLEPGNGETGSLALNLSV